MGSLQLTGTTFVPTVGTVTWLAGLQMGDGDSYPDDVAWLTTYGPHGHLTAEEQQTFLRYEPRVPSRVAKQVLPTVRFV